MHQTQTPATDQPAMPPPVERIPGRRRLPTPAECDILTRLANTLAGCGVNGAGSAPAVFAKLLVGWEHGLDPGVSLNDLKLIDGRLTVPEVVAVAAIRGSGIGDIRTIQVANERAAVEVTRADWTPGTFKTVTYTAQDAIAAGLLQLDTQGHNVSRKDNWRKSLPSMLLARARGEAKRRYFEEDAAGLAYSPDELGADTDEDGRAAEPVAIDRPAALTRIPVPPELPRLHELPPSPASDFAEPAGEATPPPGPTARAPAPQTPAPPTDDPLIAEAAEHVAALKLTKEQWQQVVRRLGLGAESIRTVSPVAKARIVQFVGNLHRIDQLRNLANIDDVAWAKVLQKRNLSRAIDLMPDDAQAIYNKLAALATPFDRNRLGIPDPATNQGDTLAGKASTSSPTPAPVAA